MGAEIERLARALCEADGKNPDEPTVGRYNINDMTNPTLVLQRRWEQRIPDVRAILTALREPGRNLCAAVADKHWEDDLRLGEQTVAEIFATAIDHILNEDQG